MMQRFFRRRNSDLRPRKKVHLGLLATALGIAFGFTPVKEANACCFCQPVMNLMDPIVWEEAEEEFDDVLEDEFLRMERFFVNEFWAQTVLPMMMLAAEQFTVTAMQQAMIIGTFIDAENQLEAQRLLQEIHADIHKQYHPSEGMCQFGSVMKSIAASERRGEITALVFDKRALDRELGNIDSSGMYGEDLDQQNRLFQFSQKFCHDRDRNTMMAELCASTAATVINDDGRAIINKDIDYFASVNSRWTLNLDFTNQRITDTSATPPIRNQDEENLFAMNSNLFGHTLFPRAPASLLTNQPLLPLNDMQKTYMKMRSVVAKRTVANNSFLAVTGMKAEGNRSRGGTGASEPMHARIYMEAVMRELGVPAGEVLQILGENPSYYAQMEVLTKKLYQTPDFYTNLYETPANIERKATALQAIKLMQKFDLLKSFLRSEASFSVLLELAVLELQGEVEDTIGQLDASAE